MFTICISTYNRPNYLKRLLRFYESRNKDFKIFIGDSNSLEDHKEIKKFIKKLKNSHNIEIFHNPRKNFMNVIETHKILFKNIKTKYMVICPDDDVQLPISIYRMCKVLELNKELIGINGKCIHFDPVKNYFSNYPLLGLEQDNALDRVTSFFENYFTILFSVFRTEEMRFIFEHLYEKNETLKAEIHPGCYAAILGKIRNINEIQLIRPSEEQKKYKLKKLDIDSNHVNEFLDIISSSVAKQDGFELDLIRSSVGKSFKKFITAKPNYSILSKIKSFFDNIKINKIVKNNFNKDFTDLTSFIIQNKILKN